VHLDWILHPLTQYGFLVAGLGLCLWLCFNSQKATGPEGAPARARWRARVDCQDQMLIRIQGEVRELREKLKELEESLAAVPVSAVPQAGMNLSRRAQILRMHKRGERPEQIAAALNLPPSEVELLLKLHLAAAQDIPPSTSSSPASGPIVPWA